MSDINSIYNKPLIWQTNIDTSNAPFIPYLEQMERVPKCLTIVTLQSMNLDEGVEIASPDNLIEATNEDELNSGDNKYLVLHERGQIKFSKNLEGQMIHIKFKGDGAMYMSADRIWTKLDNNGNVLETVQSDMQTVRDGVELFKNATDLVSLDTSIKLDIENAKNIESEVNNSIVLATQSNNTLKATTDSAKLEDTNLNTAIDTAKATNTTLTATNSSATTTNANLSANITAGTQLNTDLTTLNTTATETKTNLDTSNTTALATKSALDTSNTNATSTKSALDTLNTTATTTKNDLTTINTTATQTKTDLTSINNTATTTKTDLATLNTTASNTKSALQTVTTDANTAKNNLQTAIDASNISGMKTDITNLQTSKQDKTDNTFTTTNKTVSGAISELNTNKLNETAIVGQVAMFATNTAPTGWLKCNGAIISRTSYSRLFGVIGTLWGVGDNSTTFQIPDMRGYFPRAWDDSRGIDVGRAFASYQMDDFKSHSHEQVATANPNSGGTGTIQTWSQGSAPSVGMVGYDQGVTTNSTGGTETRPKNVALLFCIKY